MKKPHLTGLFVTIIVSFILFAEDIAFAQFPSSDKTIDRPKPMHSNKPSTAYPALSYIPPNIQAPMHNYTPPPIVNPSNGKGSGSAISAVLPEIPPNLHECYHGHPCK